MAAPRHTVGTYLGRRLIEAGIAHFFAVPGDYNLLLLDELLTLPPDALRLVSCCNELNAGYAADGYARARGAGACVVTFTVGGLSAVNAVAGAYSDDLPVILVSGAPNSNDYASDRVLHHTTGRVDRRQALEVFRHVVADAVEIRSPAQAARQIDHAITTALTQRKPVYIEMACNIAQEPLPPPIPFQLTPLHFRPPSNPAALDAAVEEVLTLWRRAARPVIVVGGKVRTADALEEVVAFARAAGCAVAVTPDAKGMYPEEEEAGFIGTLWGGASSKCVQETVDASDLQLFVGVWLTDCTTVGFSTLVKKPSMVQLLADRLLTPAHEYACVSMADVLRVLAAKLPKPNPASLTTYRRILQPDAPLPADAPADTPLCMRFLTSRLQAALAAAEGAITVVAETGDAWFEGQKLRLPAGGAYESQLQYGSIGWAVGATLGYALGAAAGGGEGNGGSSHRPRWVEAQRERVRRRGGGHRVVALSGDGAFQMTVQEASTMIRYGAAPVVVVLNNRSYAIEVLLHDNVYNYNKNWDYVGVIQAFDSGENKVFAARAATQGEFAAALARAWAHRGGPSVIECIVAIEDCATELRRFGAACGRMSMRPYRPDPLAL